MLTLVTPPCCPTVSQSESCAHMGHRPCDWPLTCLQKCFAEALWAAQVFSGHLLTWWWWFSFSVMSDSLRPHGLQHARFPCPSPSPGACSNSCRLSQWCHPTISPSVWSGWPFPCPRDFPIPGIKPGSPALQAVSSISGRFWWFSLTSLCWMHELSLTFMFLPIMPHYKTFTS